MATVAAGSLKDHFSSSSSTTILHVRAYKCFYIHVHVAAVTVSLEVLLTTFKHVIKLHMTVHSPVRTSTRIQYKYDGAGFFNFEHNIWLRSGLQLNMIHETKTSMSHTWHVTQRTTGYLQATHSRHAT